MKTSQNGIDLIKKFEGCRLTAYRCPAGKWTIGYGHTSGVKEGMRITQKKAESYLKSDLKIYEKAVEKRVKVPLNQGQFDGLVSFTYNLGEGNLTSSTLLRKLNNGDYYGASGEFGRWVYSAGKKLNGLVRRREAEKALFLSGGECENVNKDNIPSLKGYKGFSIVDGLKNFGYESSFSYRAEIWKMIGKTSKYKGTSSQNTYLLNYLKSH